MITESVSLSFSLFDDDDAYTIYLYVTCQINFQPKFFFFLQKLPTQLKYLQKFKRMIIDKNTSIFLTIWDDVAENMIVTS
jgi:hypothetical protein